MNRLIEKFKKNYKLDYWLLGIFSFILIVFNIIWQRIDIHPAHWDAARHLWTSLHYNDLINNWLNTGVLNVSGLKALKHLVQSYYYYPPFYYVSTIPFYYLFGHSSDSATMVNNLYIIVLIFSTYGIGRKLWNRTTGILASLFLALSPMILALSRDYMLDMPLTAFVALTFFLLLKTDCFKNIRYALLFSISFAIGMLIKWTFAAFFVGPFIYVAGLIIFEYTKTKKIKNILSSLRSILISIFLILLLIMPWYYKNKDQLKYDFKGNGLVTVSEKGSFFLHIINDNTYFPLFIFVVIGIILSIVKLKYLKKNFLLLFSIATSLFVMYYFIKNHDARFVLQWLVFGSVIGTYWLTEINSKFWRYLLIIILLLIMAFNFVTISFGIKSIPEKKNINFGSVPITLYNQTDWITSWPITSDWKIEQIIKDISNDAKQQKRNSPIIFSSYLDDNKYFNNWNLEYYSTNNFSKYGVEFKEPERPYLVDYIVTRLGDPIDTAEKAKKPLSDYINSNQNISYDIVPINDYKLPRNTFAQLYRVYLKNDNWTMDIAKNNFATSSKIVEEQDTKYIKAEKGKSGFVTWGPYLPFNDGDYILKARLNISDNSIDNVGRIEVVVNGDPSSNYYGILELKGKDFIVSNKWQDFTLKFNNPNHTDKIEFRVVSEGKTDLSIQSLDVSK